MNFKIDFIGLTIFEPEDIIFEESQEERLKERIRLIWDLKNADLTH